MMNGDMAGGAGVVVANATDKKPVEVKEAVELKHAVKVQEDPMNQRSEEPPMNQRGEVDEEYIPNGEPDGIGIPYNTYEAVPKDVCVDCGRKIPEGCMIEYEGYEYCKLCVDNNCGRDFEEEGDDEDDDGSG